MRTETATGAHLLIATVARNDATTTLFFERLRDRVPLQFAELVPRSLRHVVRSIRAEARLAGDLSGAAALIVSRGLFEFRNLILAARSRRIPCFYFVDDNLMVLRAEGHADARHARGYRIDNVRNSLRAFDGVLCATEALREFFHEHRLHDRLQVYPPVATGPAVPSTRDDASLRLAFFGGGHRREPFMRIVWPAICRFAEHRDVTLCAAGLDDAALRPTSRLTIVTVPYQRDYDAALGAMRSHAIDVLLHPSSDTANNRYKNPHVLINARTLGAAPIFSNAPPYDAVASDGVCVLADNTPDSWLEALNAIADAGARSRMLANIDRYCEQHF
ncbi:MAG TPA: hypothetical protein VEA16_16230, partial [Vicinamibacterales bacterium]|nr:hypothetical protein [Vicinamibacterales bacterium]